MDINVDTEAGLSLAPGTEINNTIEDGSSMQWLLTKDYCIIHQHFIQKVVDQTGRNYSRTRTKARKLCQKKTLFNINDGRRCRWWVQLNRLGNVLGSWH